MAKNNSVKIGAGKTAPTLKKKGSFEEIDGDLVKLGLQGAFDFIGHGCNCFATMGAGIALPISIAFPKAKLADREFEAPSYMRLGNFTMGREKLKQGGFLRIVNFYSQYQPGKAFDKESLILSLRKFATFLKEENPSLTPHSIGLPLIGCGIAGGDWSEVKEIIKTELADLNVTIVHFKSDDDE